MLAFTSNVGAYKRNAWYNLICLLQTYYLLSANEKLSVSWQFSETCGVISYSNGWRKGVVNQCLELALFHNYYTRGAGRNVLALGETAVFQKLFDGLEDPPQRTTAVIEGSRVSTQWTLEGEEELIYNQGLYVLPTEANLCSAVNKQKHNHPTKMIFFYI